MAPPRLPPGALREFKRYLYRLYLSAGTPSLDRIAETAALDDSLPGAPSRDTVGRLLTGAKLPGLHDAESVTAVLARLMDRDPAETVVRIRELWIEAKERPGRPRTAEAWGAARLGVHHAVDVDGAGFDRLTPYIERTHDETVRERLRCARGGEAVLAVLVGQSSTGKTRSAFEAVRIELPDWPVLFPSGPRELLDWVAGDAVDAGSVIWLNETQRYLTGPAGEDVAESWPASSAGRPHSPSSAACGPSTRAVSRPRAATTTSTPVPCCAPTTPRSSSRTTSAAAWAGPGRRPRTTRGCGRRWRRPVNRRGSSSS
ncbi:hypothetical protein O1M54_43620 [Streptomyces diastatochromogenes]|nr:hypothetical protein [Streptomyces diastatochromogenes]